VQAQKRDVYKAFISSPGDVKRERQLAVETITAINHRLEYTLQASIDPVVWEHITGHDPEAYQRDLNKRLAECHFFILIVNQRYGTGEAVSRTESELQTFLAAQEKRRDKPRILVYLRELSQNDDPGQQRIKALAFRDRLQSLNVVKDYKSDEEFQYQLAQDLYDVVLRIQLLPSKRQALSHFWRFGRSNTATRVGVVYPPSDPIAQDKAFWTRRLTTEMSFEDYKALSKIEKAFQLLPVRDYHVYPQMNVPIDIERMNRVWLCLPRNRKGIEALLKHRPNLQFDLPPPARGGLTRRTRPNIIRWESRHGNAIEVQSPMAEYLLQQRTADRVRLRGEWHPEHANILAKDYAVLARLERHGPYGDDGSPLWDYFFAGIRGLGTWGSTWYMDKHCRDLQKIDIENGGTNIQLLLEVTLSDAVISEVRDVSDEPEAYFKEQNNQRYIKSRVKGHNRA
jgi:hypothetical protein